jgi:hypothetical protein
MRRLKFLSLLLFATALFGYSVWRFPLPLHGGPLILQALGADLALGLAALAWGRSLLSRFKLFHDSLSEELVLSLGMGWVALSLVGSLLGAVGVLYAWLAWLCVGLILVVHWDHLEHFGRTFQRNLRVKHPWDGSSTEVLALVAGVLGLLAMLGLCLAPVTFYDALNYHLAGVQRSVQLGRDLPQADNLFTWLPDMVQPLWALALLLSGAPAASSLAPALLNAALALVLGLALVDASSRWLSERRLWLAPALAWTQPLLILSFGVFSPDPWMATFAFVSLFAFIRATQEQDKARLGAWLGLAALLSGAACAAKPVALWHAAALCLLWLRQAWTKPSWRRSLWLISGASFFLLPLLPWLLRGAILHSNPFYPFGLSLWGHSFLAGGPSAYFDQISTYGGAWWQLPWQVFYEPFSLGGGGHLSWLLLALAPAAWAWRYSPPQRTLAYYVLASAVLWCLGPHVLRYGLFALPAACLLAVHGVLEVEVWAASKGWAYAWRTLVLAGLFMGAGQSLLIATKDFQPWDVALGLQDPVDYLSERGVPQAEAAAWIQAHQKGRSRVLVLGDARTAYLPADALASSGFDEHPFKAWAAQASSPQDLGAIVRRKGYDFVLFSRAEWTRVEDPARPLYWSRQDVATAQRVNAWLESLAVERPHLELKRGAGWVFELR